MKTISLIALALCTFAIACNLNDTERPEKWERSTEARLIGQENWTACRTTALTAERAVPEVVCGTPAAAGDADDCGVLKTREDAARALPRAACTNEAIELLESLAPTNTDAEIDLGAAYFLRAQRHDDPLDVFRAYRTLEKTSFVRNGSKELQFNRALVLEAMGLNDDAAKEWTAYLVLDPSSPWATEARQHLTRLASMPEESETARRARAIRPLDAALLRHDTVAIEAAIRAFPQTAERHLYDDLLPDWGRDGSPATLAKARALAEALSRRSGDKFPLAVIEAIDRAAGSPEKTAALQQGHVTYGDARVKKPKSDFRTASQELARGGSPMRMMSDVRAVAYLSLSEAQATLDGTITEATRAGYFSLRATALATRAYALVYDSRYLEALTDYDAALEALKRARDMETMIAMHTRRVGVVRLLGNAEATGKEVLLYMRDLPRVAASGDRHLGLGEAGLMALMPGINDPALALRFQNAELQLSRSQLAEAATDGDRSEAETRLVTALRGRAHIETLLERIAEATQDLDEATRHAPLILDARSRNSVTADLHQVGGDLLLLTKNPQGAIAEFSEAIVASDPKTLQASIYLQRATAYLHANRLYEADSDQRTALDLIRSEEAEILARRRAVDPKGEEFWSTYFSRFQEKYREYIATQIEGGKPDEAFVYAERARAVEPLDQVVTRGRASAELRNVTVRDVQARMPPNTFLLEYCVLTDKTFVWIISRDAHRLLTLPIKRSEIQRWSDNVARAAAVTNVKNLEAAVYPPYELVREPLAAIRAMQPNAPAPHLVFALDGPTNGLPLAALHDPQSQHYLLQQTSSIALDGSAALYVAALDRDRELGPEQRPSILLIGNPAFVDRSHFFGDLGPLPHAVDEVREIAPLYPLSTTLIGAEATIENVERETRGRSIVHIAAHAIPNAGAPDRSQLLLAGSGNASGAVTAQELVKNSALEHTRLVILSACSTAGGGGLTIGAEGLAPLVRPWIAAGVPAVIGSLWNVEDATAGHLLVSFHRQHRGQAKDAAIALHDAQLEMLQTGKTGYSSAMAWGSFQVIGHASAPAESPPP